MQLIFIKLSPTNVCEYKKLPIRKGSSQSTIRRLCRLQNMFGHADGPVACLAVLSPTKQTARCAICVAPRDLVQNLCKLLVKRVNPLVVAADHTGLIVAKKVGNMPFKYAATTYKVLFIHINCIVNVVFYNARTKPRALERFKRKVCIQVGTVHFCSSVWVPLQRAHNVTATTIFSR